jgi:molybdate-binding protein/DNA-binding XRE family transcriptional regulator
MASVNRVREWRTARCLSQVALAASASLSRQSVNAIESGRATPSVDIALRLAAALDTKVEELFGTTLDAASVVADPCERAGLGRVALAHIAGRWISQPLDREGMAISADGLAERPVGKRSHIALLRAGLESRQNVLVMGCAPALGLLADRLNARSGSGRFLWFPRSSTAALEALARAQTHLAGVHLVDAKTREANLPDVRRHARQPTTVITLASWETGFVTARGNPKRIRKAAQLARRGLRLVGRESGSGARRLLESELKRAGLPTSLAARAHLQAGGQLEVAQAVAAGAADVGIATRDAAIAFGLEFVALAQERYDLALASDDLADPRLLRLFDVMTAAPFRRELAALGYDVAACGQRVAEVNAP